MRKKVALLGSAFCFFVLIVNSINAKAQTTEEVPDTVAAEATVDSGVVAVGVNPNAGKFDTLLLGTVSLIAEKQDLDTVMNQIKREVATHHDYDTLLMKGVGDYYYIAGERVPLNVKRSENYFYYMITGLPNPIIYYPSPYDERAYIKKLPVAINRNVEVYLIKDKVEEEK